jgi:two-component system response regulator RegX3
MATRTILVVEDEESIALPLAAALEREGYATRVTGSAPAAIALAAELQPDLMLLDVMLSDGSGLDVCREVRRFSSLPIIMLTARGDETDRVVGLELGADDYVVKPFGAAELIARIRAVLRRSSTPDADAPAVLQVGDVEMNLHTHSVTHAGSAIDLTLKEFELLRMLMEGAGRVVSRTNLIDEVWDPNWYGSTKTLDVHVSSLRKKLSDDPASPRYIHTIRGVGFRFSSQDELSQSSAR